MTKIKRFKSLFSSSDGQVAIIIALLIVSIVGMTALVVDMGALYEDRRTLQGTADAAALAGVQELPESTENSTQEIMDNIVNNYDDENDNIAVDIQYDAYGGVPNTSVTVTVTNPDSPIRFGAVYGSSATDVSAYATAVIGSPEAYTKVVPWGLLEGDYAYGTEYTLKYGAPPELAPGNFGALGIDGPGANIYEDSIVNGTETELTIGDWVDVETGNMAGPTRDGVEERVEGQQDYEWSTDLITPAPEYALARGDSQLIIIPIISHWPHGHSEQVQILGFKPFILSGYTGHGGHAEVIGTFLNYALTIMDGKIVGLDDETGIRIIRLIE
jgi:Flp pilus assembly protein TadG